MIPLTALQADDICVLEGDLYSIDPDGHHRSGNMAMKSKTTGECKSFHRTTMVDLYEGDLVDEGETTDEDEIDDAVTYKMPLDTILPIELFGNSTCGEGKSNEECCGGNSAVEGEENE